MLGEIEKHFGLMVWLYDAASEGLLYASESYEAISGRPVQSLYDAPASWLDAIVPEDRDRVETAFERLLEGELYDQEFRISRPDGTLRSIRSRGSAVRDSLGRVLRVAGVSEDVTDQMDLLRRLRGAMIAAETAEETERRRLAADLHDSVGQILPLARIKLAELRDELGDSPLRERTQELVSLLAETEEQLRSATFRLSPIPVAEIGLVAALRRLAELLSFRYGLRVSVQDDGLPKPLDGARESALLRGARELLINVARHAQTDKAEVRIAREGESVVVTVEDGGIGFDATAERPTGFGLLSLRDRVESLGGSLEIESKPRGGTRARIVVPSRGGAGSA
jgi:PAS domain S-box-containing protein